MKKAKSFKCAEHGIDRKPFIFEQFVFDGIRMIKCECGKDAFMQLSAPKFINNSTGKNASWR